MRVRSGDIVFELRSGRRVRPLACIVWLVTPRRERAGACLFLIQPEALRIELLREVRRPGCLRTQISRPRYRRVGYPRERLGREPRVPGELVSYQTHDLHAYDAELLHAVVEVALQVSSRLVSLSRVVRKYPLAPVLRALREVDEFHEE